MGRIRPFVADDIPAVAALHQWVFRNRSGAAPVSLQEYFAGVFLHNPWQEDRHPSLVAVDRRGQICGFLGILTRPMCRNDTPVIVQVSSQLMVAPTGRGATGLQLLKSFFAEAPGLLLTDGANDNARKLWHALGGQTAQLYSLQWMRLLHPAGYLLQRIRSRRRLRPLAAMGSPLARLLDRAAARITDGRFFPRPPDTVAQPLPTARWLELLRQPNRDYVLRPVYTEAALQWLLDRATEVQGHGTLQKVLVQTPQGSVAGWFLYYLQPGGICQVMQIGATHRTIAPVLNHLFYHAAERGAAALCGRLDPLFLPAFAEARCALSTAGGWMLVHSSQPEMLRPVFEGRAFLSRFEGEWWMRFQVDGFDSQ